MGCFGYICKGCGTPINGDCFAGGEKCVLIHVRHGEEIGRVEGRYDEYGRVIDQEGLPDEERFRGRGDGINGHSEICNSEFQFDDSYLRLQGIRVYRGQEVSFDRYITIKKQELRKKHGNEIGDNFWNRKLSNYVYERYFNNLEYPKRDKYSGTAAWHSLCYNQASEAEKADLTPSDNDPNQSWGEIREKFA
jgi:hypothetical protein